MPSNPSPFDPLWIRVATPLRQAIIDGRLQPGDALSENRLAAEYDVSRTPVREALHLLMEEGLVEMLPGRKVRVALLRADDAREVYELRLVLEAEAVRRLIAMADMSPQLAELKRACADSEAALAHGDFAGLSQINERFHSVLVSVLRNRRLLAQYRTADNLIALYRNRSLRDESWARASMAEHRTFVARIEARDVPGALALLETHIARACEVVCRTIESTGLRAA